VVRHESLDDDAAAIARAFRRAADDADLVIASGGLGPTLDDVTREALAEAMGVPLEEDAGARQHLEAWAAARGRKLGPSNYRQVQFPRGAETLDNPVGTAPGIAAAIGRARVFCIPGVPGEMRQMLADQVLPRLAGARSGQAALVRTVRTFGMPESVLGEKIADLMAAGRRPRVATAVRSGIIDVHVHASGPREEVMRLLEADAAEIRRRLGPVVFGEGDEEMEAAVARLLERRPVTLAVAESCTGGLVAAKLVSVPGMSAWLLEAVVAYSNESKVRRLGVPETLIARHGAVSEPVARAMAEGARGTSGADIAIALTGIAGPAGGTPEKPVGTVWFALAHAGGAEAAQYVFLGDRQHVRERAANFALDMLRRHLVRAATGRSP
jgi:nicotinamide-nucleotide amidase